MAGYWIKWYCEVLDDPKMGTLPDRLWRRFNELCLLAKRLGSLDGSLPPIDQIAWPLHMRVEELQPDMDELIKIELVLSQENGCFKIKNYLKRQDAVPPADRMRESRKGNPEQQNESESETKMLRNVTRNVTKRNTDRERDINRDIKKENKRDRKIEVDSSVSQEAAWEHVKGELVSQGTSRAIMDNYIAYALPHSMADHNFVICTKNKGAADIIFGRAGPTIKRILAGIYGEPMGFEVVVDANMNCQKIKAQLSESH